MRDIKFRAWDGKEMLYGIGAGYSDSCYFDSTVHNKITGNWPKRMLTGWLRKDSEDLKIMQYTGLKDKNGNGKEIYHKDYFNIIGRRKGIVEWVKDGWFVVFSTYEVRLYEFLQNDHSRETKGWSYENPVS